jgi:hypothetical protein
MIKLEVHLFGALRSYAMVQDVTAESTLEIEIPEGETIEMVMRRIGIDPAGTSHLFLNGEYSARERPIREDGRLGIFPSDMSLLYRQYFPKLKE